MKRDRLTVRDYRPGIRWPIVLAWLIGLLFSSVAWWALIFGLLAPRMKP